MAGKRQHYLPQFLQRGFASSVDGRRTWLYRKDAAPREVGMRDVGVEENFYSVESDASLDESITELERDEFVEVIEQCRTNPSLATSALERIPTLIAHLEVRSRHLRTTFGALAERAWNDQLRNFENPAIGAALVRRHIQRDPAELRAMAARELRSNGLPVSLAPKMAKQTAKTIANMPDELLIATFWKPLLPHIRDALKARLAESIKKAHVDSLRRSVAPDVRAQQYRHLRFTIVEVGSNNLVLGDAAVVFHVRQGSGWKPFLNKDDDLLEVYLPVTPSKVIVGSVDAARIESEELRQHIAQTSQSFFISHESSPSTTRLSDQIGLEAMPLSEAELESISAEVVREQLS
jgi:hypothetical protein